MIDQMGFEKVYGPKKGIQIKYRVGHNHVHIFMCIFWYDIDLCNGTKKRNLADVAYYP